MIVQSLSVLISLCTNEYDFILNLKPPPHDSKPIIYNALRLEYPDMADLAVFLSFLSFSMVSVIIFSLRWPKLRFPQHRRTDPTLADLWKLTAGWKICSSDDCG